ncbi:MAG: CBO0543 family protein [Bacillota bacterium]|nr:CBO0543 family protein [Bacillota bacterium]MDP4160035.1 CBO0543 family protein [Bacillota bacterium]
MTNLDMIHQLRLELWNLSYNHWKTETLFSIKWWSMVALITISYIIWWVIVDKRRLSQILLFGSLISVCRITMDIFGNNTALWSYDIRLTPFSPSPFLHDFTVTPLALMVVYQYCHTWKKFLVWNVIVTGIISFVFFPILIKFGFLTFYSWNYFNSFILIFGFALLSRWVLLGVLKIEKNEYP